MATRQEIQVALDLVKRVNCANDLLDEIVPTLKGEKLKREAIGSQPRSMTFEEKKAKAVRCMDNVRNYTNQVSSFLSNQANRTKATTGLLALDVTLASIETDNNSLETYADTLETQLEQTSKEEDLLSVATYIETNVPNLGLVRNF